MGETGKQVNRRLDDTTIKQINDEQEAVQTMWNKLDDAVSALEETDDAVAQAVRAKLAQVRREFRRLAQSAARRKPLNPVREDENEEESATPSTSGYSTF